MQDTQYRLVCFFDDGGQLSGQRSKLQARQRGLAPCDLSQRQLYNERWVIQLINPSSDAPLCKDHTECVLCNKDHTECVLCNKDHTECVLWETFASASRHDFGKALVAAQDWMDKNVRDEPCESKLQARQRGLAPCDLSQRQLDTSDVELRMASLFPRSSANTDAVMHMMIKALANQNGYQIKQPPVLEKIDG